MGAIHIDCHGISFDHVRPLRAIGGREENLIDCHSISFDHVRPLRAIGGREETLMI
jgi:hypothetical protein